MDELIEAAFSRWRGRGDQINTGGFFRMRAHHNKGAGGAGGAGGGGTGAGGAGAGGAAGGAGGAAGGADDGDDDGAGDDDDDETKPTLSQREKKKLIEQRDTLKKQKRAFTAMLDDLGVDVEQVDDGKGGKKLAIRGADKIKALVAAAAGGADDDDDDDAADGADDDKPAKKKGKGTAADRARDLVERKLAKVEANATKREQALTGLINQLAVRDQLRAVLAAEGAIDTSDADAGEEPYQELVEIIEKQIGVDLDTDDDTGALSLSRFVKDKDGKPATDAKGNPITMAAHVRAWLNKRQHHRRADWSPGPGAGQGGGGGGGHTSTSRTNRPQGAEAHAASSAWAIFGLDDPTAAAKR